MYHLLIDALRPAVMLLRLNDASVNIGRSLRVWDFTREKCKALYGTTGYKHKKNSNNFKKNFIKNLKKAPS